jgi:hypothetical protein
MGIGGRCIRKATQHVALLARAVAWVERQPVGQLFNSIAVQVDLELVHSLRMIAGCRDFARDRMTDVDDEYRADFTAEKIKVRDIESDILASYG